MTDPTSAMKAAVSTTKQSDPNSPRTLHDIQMTTRISTLKVYQALSPQRFAPLEGQIKVLWGTEEGFARYVSYKVAQDGQSFELDGTRYQKIPEQPLWVHAVRLPEPMQGPDDPSF